MFLNPANQCILELGFDPAATLDPVTGESLQGNGHVPGREDQIGPLYQTKSGFLDQQGGLPGSI